jgi:hypothetical protein
VKERLEHFDVCIRCGYRIDRTQQLRCVCEFEGAFSPLCALTQHLGAQAERLGALQLVQVSGLGRSELLQGRVGSAGQVHRPRCGERPARTPRRIGRQLRRSLQERRRRSITATRACPVGRSLELAGHLLVRPGESLRTMPGAAIGIGDRIGQLRERRVRQATLLGRGRGVDRRPHQRVEEPHPRADPNQVGTLRGTSRTRVDPEQLAGPPQQRGITDGLGRRHKQQGPRLGRKLHQAPPKTLLDPARQPDLLEQPKPARKLVQTESSRKLEQRQRVPLRLGQDPLDDLSVDAARQRAQQQGARVSVSETLELKLFHPDQLGELDVVASSEHHRNRISVQAACHHTERPCRSPVEPLRVVDDHKQWLRRTGGRKQAQNAEADEERLGRSAEPKAEGCLECKPLRLGQLREPVEQGSAQLLQPRKRQLHLRLDTRGPHDLKALG